MTNKNKSNSREKNKRHSVAAFVEAFEKVLNLGFKGPCKEKALA